MIKYVDIEKDKQILLEDLELSERAKNVLRRFLKVETFGDLLKVDYEKLKNTRSLGKITLEEIRTFVHNKGYFLFNESVSWKVKRELLKEGRCKLLEDEGFLYDFAKFFYQNNLFTLDDIFYFGSEVFKLKGFGSGIQKYFENFLNESYITLAYEDATKILNQFRNSKKKDKEFNYTLLDIVFIKEIGNLYFRTRNALNDSGIYSLNDLINIDYNELKDKLCDISDIELLELVNFLHSYGFLIKGYDQTNYNTRPLKKEQTLETEEVNVEKVEQENLEIVGRIDKKKELINKYKDAITRREMLLEEEAKLDLEIAKILEEMKEFNNHGKVR